MSTTPADILNLVFTDLNTWAGENGGVCRLTQNPFDLLEMMAEQPGGWRLIILWEGDDPSDPSVRGSSVVDNNFRFIVDGDLGPTMIPKVALIRETAARTPFLELLDAVRFRVMCYRFTGLSEPNNHFWYRGTDDNVPLPDGMLLAAYNLRFVLRSIKTMPGEDDEIELGAQ